MTNERSKLFQDATIGYISVDDVYVKNLIDTIWMQREKNVSQVGMNPIFSGATHTRFAHSLGVYSIGRKIFESIKQSVKKLTKKQQRWLQEPLHLYEILFHIACLLHDIGHPAFSHSLEYLYRDDYSDIELTTSTTTAIELDEILSAFLARYIKLSENEPNKSILEDTFINTLSRLEQINLGDELHAAPHEIMGAYQILTQDEIRKAIVTILEEKQISLPDAPDERNVFIDDCLAFIARMITGYRYNISEAVKNCTDDTATIKIREKYSLRNCIISLLNDKIDADMLDYLNRNSHFAGYASNNIDLHRLCSAFTLTYDKNTNIFSREISKSALSSMDGVIQARNFEPKWLYSHHKVVYFNDVLLKYLVKISGKHFFGLHQADIENALLKKLFSDKNYFDLLLSSNADKNFLMESYNDYCNDTICETMTENADDVKSDSEKSAIILFNNTRKEIIKKLLQNKIRPENIQDHTDIPKFDLFNYLYFTLNKINLLTHFNAIAKNKLDTVDELVITVNDILGRFNYAFANVILAPNTKFKYDGGFFVPYVFYKTTDADLEKFFKDMEESSAVTSGATDIRSKLYKDFLEEFRTRKYRKTLWKSYEEYRLFVEGTIKGTPISFELASELLIQLLEKYSHSAHCIELEDIQATERSTIRKKPRDLEAIYINTPKAVSDETKFYKHDEFFKLFKCLGDGMILRIYHAHFKSFDDLTINFDDNSEKYSKFRTMPKPKDFYFPYIYYKEQDHETFTQDPKNNAKILRQELIKELQDNFKRYLLTLFKETQSMDIENVNALDGKIIRDSVHGDILIKKKYLPIIQCQAFQRLHRIKQLATANYVFPEAVHTRFAHSLGTYHVMTKIVDHFCELFDKLKISYTERDTDVILVAALLHDIGHGPLSHTFEDISGKQKSHEEWTHDIILNDEELNTALTKQWGKSFPEEVVECLNRKTSDTHSLKYVFSELISSNLDADRIDYLLRDSQNTGEKFGIFDIQKLISSMRLTEYDGQLCVALSHNALPAVEQFIDGRHKMYSMVYFAPYKLMTEQLFRNICNSIISNAKTCSDSSVAKMQDIGKKLQQLTIYKISTGDVTIDEYLKLDDYSVMYEITEAVNMLSSLPNGTKYKLMLDSFLYRKGYERKHILYDGLADLEKYKTRLSKEKKFKFLNHSKIEIQKTFCAYKPEKGLREKEILIVYDNGEVKPFSKASKYANYFKTNESETELKRNLWETSFIAVYLNKDILDEELKEHNVKNFEEERNKLIKIIDSYDMNKHTEIENKYFCSRATFETAKNKFAKKTFLPDYQISKSESKDQCDIYYDTDNFDLANADYTLRCRKLNGKNKFTLKKPGSKGEGSAEAQFIRLEFEIESKSDSLTSPKVLEFLQNNDLDDDIPAVNSAKGRDFANLKPVIQIKNNRECYIVRNNPEDEFKCEVSFDHITYNSMRETSKVMEDYQIEMELKDCNCLYRVTLNTFATQFCKEMKIDEKAQKATNSKYIHALDRLGLRSSSKKS